MVFPVVCRLIHCLMDRGGLNSRARAAGRVQRHVHSSTRNLFSLSVRLSSCRVENGAYWYDGDQRGLVPGVSIGSLYYGGIWVEGGERVWGERGMVTLVGGGVIIGIGVSGWFGGRHLLWANKARNGRSGSGRGERRGFERGRGERRGFDRGRRRSVG